MGSLPSTPRHDLPNRAAVGARDAAARRLRRVTGGAIALTVALGGIFVSFAAGSTHTKKTLVTRAAESTSAPTIIRNAPAPPLVSAQGAATPASAPQPSQSSPPPAAPAPTYSPPVVVSGGS
jgi:hypothetical protein